MTELTEPDLNRRERWTRDYILEILPSGYGDPADRSEEQVSVAKSVLAKQYVEHAKLDLYWKMGLVLLAYDWLFLLQSQVYGLVIGAIGSLTLALPNLYTPELLAEDAFEDSDALSKEIKSKAALSVKTNVGVAGLIVGFVWQVFSISGPIPGELISQNHLQGVVQNWLGFAVIFGLLLLCIRVYNLWRDGTQESGD